MIYGMMESALLGDKTNNIIILLVEYVYNEI